MIGPSRSGQSCVSPRRISGMESTFNCAWCGEPNDLFVDPSGGPRQQYVEDCQVCCRPNLLTVQCVDGSDEFVLQVERENQ